MSLAFEIPFDVDAVLRRYADKLPVREPRALRGAEILDLLPDITAPDGRVLHPDGLYDYDEALYQDTDHVEALRAAWLNQGLEAVIAYLTPYFRAAAAMPEQAQRPLVRRRHTNDPHSANVAGNVPAKKVDPSA